MFVRDPTLHMMALASRGTNNAFFPMSARVINPVAHFSGYDNYNIFIIVFWLFFVVNLCVARKNRKGIGR